MTRASRRPFTLAVAAVLASLVALAMVASPALAQSGPKRFGTRLTGLGEVPAVLTDARGTFEMRISNDGTMVEYRLSYTGFDSAVAAAHIHIGQHFANGGVAVFLCGGGGAPACPSPGGTVEDSFIAADVLAIPAQGLAAGDLEALLHAIRAGVAYANVHSADHPSGEIRGQLRQGGRGGGNDDDDD